MSCTGRGSPPGAFILKRLPFLAALLLPGIRESRADDITITFKVVKRTAGMAAAKPTVRLLTGGDKWRVRNEPTWSGENPREVFFTIQSPDSEAPLPRVEVAAPGVGPARVIVGRQDVGFVLRDGSIEFTAVRDTRKAMLLSQVLPDPGNGPGIHVYHNWNIRQDGPYRGKPYPETETRAVLNYLVAAREALKVLGGTGPRGGKPFTGDITLMGFETACTLGHHDHPPHVHIMLWVPGYAGSEIPHLYMDPEGRIVRNKLIVIGDEGGTASPELLAAIARKKGREGDYGPGNTCRLFDLEDRLALEITITPEGGVLLGRGDGREACLVIGGAKGPAGAVLVRRGAEALVSVRVTDDAEAGEMRVTVEHLKGGKAVRTVNQVMRYDPFTGLDR